MSHTARKYNASLGVARTCFAAKHYERAEPLLLRVVEENPEFADVHNMLGVIHHEQGDYPRAQKDFETALQINPRYTDAALNLAVLCNDTGQYDVARDLYDRAVTHARKGPGEMPRGVAAKLSNMHAELGDAYTAAGMHMEAAGEYEHALALCPDFVDIRGKLAKALREIGDFERAIGEYEAILKKNAAYVPARVSLGLVLFHAGRRNEAIAHWQKVLRLDPGHAAVGSYLKMAGVEPKP